MCIPTRKATLSSTVGGTAITPLNPNRTSTARRDSIRHHLDKASTAIRNRIHSMRTRKTTTMSLANIIADSRPARSTKRDLMLSKLNREANMNTLAIAAIWMKVELTVRSSSHASKNMASLLNLRRLSATVSTIRDQASSSNPPHSTTRRTVLTTPPLHLKTKTHLVTRTNLASLLSTHNPTGRS